MGWSRPAHMPHGMLWEVMTSQLPMSSFLTTPTRYPDPCLQICGSSRHSGIVLLKKPSVHGEGPSKTFLVNELQIHSWDYTSSEEKRGMKHGIQSVQGLELAELCWHCARYQIIIDVPAHFRPLLHALCTPLTPFKSLSFFKTKCCGLDR